MYAMQYAITLPADYDMAVIRDRVATRGSALDEYRGLGVKAYLIREAGVDGSPVNEYAPFYLWTDVTAMARFLWGGGGFRGIISSFGRPAVRHWAGAGFTAGPAIAETPTAASRHLTMLDQHCDPSDAVGAAVRWAAELAGDPRAHSAAVAVDPVTWQVVLFTLWTAPVSDAPGDRYQVLHLSRPYVHDLEGAPVA